MTWCNESEDHERGIHQIRDVTPTPLITPPSPKSSQDQNGIVTCPSCGHTLEFQDQGGIHELPGLPAGVKFDPNDQEILEHLEGKVVCDVRKLHPLTDQFIPTLEGENGICYTHPEKLPGVSKDGQIRHFFHRPSKAYTTGTRKRRKVQTEEEGSETRWHKTGKTRAVFVNGEVKGFKKILVLYTNYGRKRKPEKTSWVMHQYHLGGNEEEREGELVVSKVFFQTQPRQCANNNNNTTTNNSSSSNIIQRQGHGFTTILPNKNIASASSSGVLEYYNNSPPTNYIDNNYDDDQHHHNNNNNNVMMMMMGHSHTHHHNSTSVGETSPQLIPNLVLQGDAASSFFSFANACKQSKTF